MKDKEDDYKGEDVEVKEEGERNILKEFGIDKVLEQAGSLQKIAAERAESIKNAAPAQLDIPTKEGGFIKVSFDLRMTEQELIDLFDRAIYIKVLYEEDRAHPEDTRELIAKEKPKEDKK